MTMLQAGAGVENNAYMPLREHAESGRISVKFPRTARLLKHADFRRVYEQGRRHFSTNLTAFYVVPATSAGPRIGYTVSRALGGAVERNRMKRRLREATREAWNGFSAGVDIVVNPKKSLLTADFAGVVEEMRKALAVVGKAAASGHANPRPAENVLKDRKPRAAKGQR